jgi:predicted amidophosphoribosyltransferase
MIIRCAACGRNLKSDERKCPRCGELVAEKLAGVLKTSTILISADDIDGVYRSMQDVPEPLRKRLLRTTNGVNSRIILIADRRGRQEIAKALKKLPGASQRRLSNSLLTGNTPPALPKLTIAQAVGILLAGATGLLAWLILTHT